MEVNQFLENTLEQLYNQTGRKHDCYYQEGTGVLIVPHEYELLPQNVILTIDEMQIRMMTGFSNLNNSFKIHFG